MESGMRDGNWMQVLPPVVRETADQSGVGGSAITAFMDHACELRPDGIPDWSNRVVILNLRQCLFGGRQQSNRGKSLTIAACDAHRYSE